MAAKKKSSKKTSTKKKATKTTARRKKAKRSSAASLIGGDLPKSLSALTRQLTRDLTAVEKQIETAGKETRRSLTRIVRDASHQLGVLETRGQKAWSSASARARKEVQGTVRRVQRAIKQR